MPTPKTRPVPRGEWLTVRQVSERLLCSEQHVRNLILTGRLTAKDIGTGDRPLYRVAENWLTEYMGRAA